MSSSLRTDSSGLFGALQVGGADVLRFGADNSGQLAGFRNRIINGDFRVQQRGATGTFLNGVSSYCADRWLGFVTGANNSWSYGGGLDGGATLLINGAASTTLSVLQQRVEAADCAYLVGKSVTLSALIYSTVNKDIHLELSHATVVDNFSATTSIGSVLKSLVIGWNYVTATFNNLPAGAVNGLMAQFNWGAFTSGAVGVTKAQLEEGSIATPFEHRPIGLELSLCQRYYQKVRARIGGWTGVGVTNSYVIMLPVPMRIAPSIVVDSTTNVGTTGSTILGDSAVSVIHDSIGSGSGGFVSAANASLSAEL